MYKKRYRKRRIRYRRRRYVRKKSAPVCARVKPEVKYLTVVQDAQALKAVVTATSSSSLFKEQIYLNNILSQIVPGTGSDQRIGKNICIKHILVDQIVYSCSTVSTNNYLLRHIWHSGNISPNTTEITGFFGCETKMNINSFVNRRYLQFHYDRTFSVTSGEQSSNTMTRTGAVKHIKYKVPINRTVTYDQNGYMKQDGDVYSLALLVMTPGTTAAMYTDQVLCSYTKYRVYYTDA